MIDLPPSNSGSLRFVPRVFSFRRCDAELAELEPWLAELELWQTCTHDSPEAQSLSEWHRRLPQCEGDTLHPASSSESSHVDGWAMQRNMVVVRPLHAWAAILVK